MTKRRSSPPRTICLLLFLALATTVIAQPSPAAGAAFDSYVRLLEARLAAQHQSNVGFLAFAEPAPQTEARLRQGKLILENMTPANGGALPGALLHHWRGTSFVPGVSVADLEYLLRDFDSYPRYFAPQVLQATTIGKTTEHLEVSMRIRQRHGITVVMETTYDVAFGALDPRHRYSISRSTRISEVGSPGTRDEHILGVDDEHGFLWSQKTYWTYEETGAGLYMQIESVSLTRSIPIGLGWVVRPFVESIPRDSLEFTLRCVHDALLKKMARTTRMTTQ